jgi:hypothetical protein
LGEKTVSLEIKINDAKPVFDTSEFAAEDLITNIVTVKDTESVEVPRGENEGRKLSHVWVVKSLRVEPFQIGKQVIEIPSSTLTPEHSRVVVYVQSKSTGVITGAAVLEL